MLFKDTKKLVEYAEMSITTNFISLKATLRMVEEQHIIPLVGPDQYHSLNDLYEAAEVETTLSQANKNLLHQCRLVIGPMLCYYYAPKSDVTLSNAGMQRLETGSNKTAYQEQRTQFREQNLREGEVASELLLQFLEDNKTYYPLWVGTPAFKKYRSLFIKSGKEFQELFTSHSPCRNYLAMRPTMMQVEENSIRNLLGDVLFDDLKAKDNLTTPVFTVKEKLLLEKIKRAIAFLTVAFSIPLLNIRIDANGITVASGAGTTDNQITSRKASPDNALDPMIRNCEASGIAWLKNAENYLNRADNLLAFTGWPIIIIVTEVELRGIETRNCDRRGSYGLF